MKYTACYLLSVGLLLSASGCASKSIYHPYRSGVGFAEKPANGGSILVSFQASEKRGREEIRDWCLLRAAELAVDRGKAYFEIDEEYFRTDNRAHPPEMPQLASLDADGKPVYTSTSRAFLGSDRQEYVSANMLIRFMDTEFDGRTGTMVYASEPTLLDLSVKLGR